MLTLVSQALSTVEGKLGYKIDFQVDHKRFRYKCQAFEHGEPVLDFRVHIFATRHQKEHVVEFQRRSGDTIMFARLWQKCRSFFHKGNGVDYRSGLVDESLPDISDVSQEKMRTFCDNLIEMA